MRAPMAAGLTCRYIAVDQSSRRAAGDAAAVEPQAHRHAGPAFEPAADIMRAARADAAGIAARQQQRLAELLEAARATRRYAAWLRGRDPQQVALADLPVVRKAHLMQHLPAAVADPAITLPSLRAFTRQPALIAQPYLGRYWVWESSGSSGEPGIYVQDDRAMAVYDALEATRRASPRPWIRWFDPWYLSERFAFVGATTGHFASHVSVQRLRLAHPQATRQWHSVSILQPLATLVSALNQIRPTIVATYPTAAAVLADEARAGRLHIQPLELWTGGETLSAAVRRRIESTWGCAVRNSYGASEFLPIAWECPAGQLHVNADWVILEAVDRRWRPVSAGALSHTTLLTNLANHVQPLIRFDIGDSTRLPGIACTCGSALPVVQVQGRRDDTLQVPGARGGLVPLLPLVLTTVLEEGAEVFDFCLRQTAADALQLDLGPSASHTPGSRRRCREVLAAFVRQQGASDLRISTNVGHRLPLGPSGKLQRVVGMAAARRCGDT
jgi:phenylacetate-CoA ligase